MGAYQMPGDAACQFVPKQAPKSALPHSPRRVAPGALKAARPCRPPPEHRNAGGGFGEQYETRRLWYYKPFNEVEVGSFNGAGDPYSVLRMASPPR